MDILIILLNTMQNLLNKLPFDPEWLIALAVASLLLFLLSLIFIPWLITRLPSDYFTDEKRHISKTRNSHPLLYYSLRILKNILGWLLVIAGICMLILPGQGILTILVGLGLSDFPGKFNLLRKIAQQPPIFKTMNWIRQKTNHKPLQKPI